MKLTHYKLPVDKQQIRETTVYDVEILSQHLAIGSHVKEPVVKMT